MHMPSISSRMALTDLQTATASQYLNNNMLNLITCFTENDMLFVTYLKEKHIL